MRKLSIIVTFLFLLMAGSAWGLSFIPGGPTGYGFETRGSYSLANDPVICIVTGLGTGSTWSVANGSLPDDTYTRSGVNVAVGTFLGALEYVPPANTGKIILFETSGEIDYTGEETRLDIELSGTAIYGQSAPSPGIHIRGAVIRLGKSSATTTDLVLQHLIIKQTDAEDAKTPDARDTLWIGGTSATVSNVLIDHVTALFGMDGTFDIGNANSGASLNNISVRKSVIAGGLLEAMHPEGEHSTGMLVSIDAENVAVIDSVFGNNRSRNPYANRDSVNLYSANNVVYNWKEKVPTEISRYSCLATDTGTTADLINNLWIEGEDSNQADYIMTWKGEVNLYLSGNYGQNGSDWDVFARGFCTTTYCEDTDRVDDEPCVKHLAVNLTPPGNYTPKAYTELKAIVTAEENGAGARPSDRDEYVTDLMADISAECDGGVEPCNTGLADCVATGTAGYVCTDSVYGATWPSLTDSDCTAENEPYDCCTGSGTGTCGDTRNLETGMAATQAGAFPTTPHTDTDSDGYTDLEEWLFILGYEVGGDPGEPGEPGEPPVPPPGSYDLLWDGEFDSDSDKAYTASGGSSTDGTIVADAAIHGDYAKDGAFGAFIGDHISWPVPLDSSDWGFCKDIYMTATTGNTQLWENYKDADDFIVGRIGDDGKVYLRQESGAGGGAITAFTTALYAVPDTTWTNVCFRGSVAENKLGIKIGANDWEDDDDETPVTAFDTGEATEFVLGEDVANYGAADDFWADNIKNYGLYAFVVTEAVAPTFDAMSCPEETYSTPGGSIVCTSTTNVSATVNGGTPTFVDETGETDVVFYYQGKNPANELQMYWSAVLLAGMRTLDLDFSSASISLNGATILNSSDMVTEATLTLPASIDNTTVIAVPGSWNIPNDYATYADLLTAVGYLIGDDAISVVDDANITITDEDGTSGHPIIINLLSWYRETLDLNHNDYYTIYTHPSGTITNSDGTDVNINYYNSGASAVSNSGGGSMGAGGNRQAIGR